jgi:hypothetical protein
MGGANGKTETHGTIRALVRIRKLIALVSLAFIWAHLVGLGRQGLEGPLRTKKHSCLEKSVFRYGLDQLRRLLLSLRVPRRRPLSAVSGSYESLSAFCRVHSCISCLRLASASHLTGLFTKEESRISSQMTNILTYRLTWRGVRDLVTARSNSDRGLTNPGRWRILTR